MSTHYGNHNSSFDFKKIRLGINTTGVNSLEEYINGKDTRESYHKHGHELKSTMLKTLANITNMDDINTALANIKPKISLNEIIDGAPNSALYEALQKKTPEACMLNLIKNF